MVAGKLCVYCGYRLATDREHVVAKGLFYDPPEELLTVPACHECNAGTGDGYTRNMSDDEAYTRDVMRLQADLAWPGDPRMEVIRKVRRSIERDRLRTEHFLTQMRWVPWLSPDLMTLSIRPAFVVDQSRLDRVQAKIARGLYFNLTGHVIGYRDTEIDIVSLLDPVDVLNFERYLSIAPWITVGDPNVFRFAVIGDAGDILGFFLEFYGILQSATLLRNRAELST